MAYDIDPLCKAVMQAVARSEAVKERYAEAVEIMRAELKAFLFDARYEDARACVMNRSLSDAYVIGLISAECIAKINAIPIPAA